MLSNWKIGTRLGLGFGILLILMMVVGLYGIQSIRGLHEEIDLLVEDRMVKVEQANALIDQINIVARALRNLIIDDNKDSQATELQRIADAARPQAAYSSNWRRPSNRKKGQPLSRKSLQKFGLPSAATSRQS